MTPSLAPSQHAKRVVREFEEKQVGQNEIVKEASDHDSFIKLKFCLLDATAILLDLFS